MRVLRFLARNWPLKIGAVFLAVVLYVGMVALQSTQVWPGAVSIEVVNQPANSYLIKPDPSTQVSGIRYIAAGDVPVTRDSFRAVIDLSSAKISETEDSIVKVQLIAEDPRIQVIDYQPQQVTVALDPIIPRQVSVRADLGVIPSGLQPGTPVLSFSTVDVLGAASIVRRVAYADAPVRIDSSGLDVNQDVDLVARDASNAVVSNVQFNPRTVHVAIQVGSQLRTQSVPVNVVLSGNPAAGYFVSAIDVNPASVSVQGQADALALLKGLANTEPISIGGATADVSTSIGLDLPTGVTSLTQSKVSVVVHVDSQGVTRSVSVGLVPTGARPDRIYTLSTTSVTVVLGGSMAALSAFDTSGLVGHVAVAGLDVGTYSAVISVTVPPGITVQAISPAQVNVTVSAPAPSPSPSP